MTALRMAVRQGSPEWLDARRGLITATDIPVLLGLSPYRCEADLAAEKAGAPSVEPNLRMRIGSALEPLIAEEYQRRNGRKLRRFRGMLRHPEIEWAGASPDYAVVGEKRLVETKWTGSRTRFADGLPQDVQAQAAWQLMVSGYPVADVAVLVADDLLTFTVERDAAMFDGLVEIAADFRARLAAGGPFTESLDSVKRRYPADDGSELVADGELEEAVLALLALRAKRKDTEAQEEALEAAIKTRMADAAVLVGRTWRVTWKRTKDRTLTDYRPIAEGLLRTLSDEDAAAMVSLYTRVEPGFRPFRVVTEKDAR